MRDGTVNEEELARMLKALASPSRLRIFNLLVEGTQCNCEISERLGYSLSLISHHTKVLSELGLVRSERDQHDARWIYHSIDRVKLNEVYASVKHLLDPERVQVRQPSCGPRIC